MSAPLCLQLVGPLRLRDAGGVDRTPRGAKAQGLLALLALHPDRRRGRRWIEARLWSDRRPEQAAGSLRQVLVELRGALGPEAGRLRADRDAVALPDLVVDVEAEPEAARAELGGGRDLLEGHGVRDPAFLAWLDEQRRRLGGAPPAPGPGLPFRIGTVAVAAGLGGVVSGALADAIGQLVSDFARVEVLADGAAVRLGAAGREDGAGLALLLDAAEGEGRLHVRLRLSDARGGRVAWARQAVLPLGTTEEGGDAVGGDFGSLVFEAAEATLAAMPRLLGRDAGPLRSEALLAEAFDDMFSFDVARLRRADALLAEAADLAPSPRLLAWRATARQFMLVERTEPNSAELRDEAEDFARRAVEGAPRSGLVLALASQAEVMLRGNSDAGRALARDAVALSPHDAFAHGSLAASLLHDGRPDEAGRAAMHGARLAERSGVPHWLTGFAGLTAIVQGDLRRATALLEAARARAPRFRAPLRHLLFLHLQSGAVEKAAAVHAQLLRLEPDFSVERVREDPAYPAGTLRRAGLVPPALPF